MTQGKETPKDKIAENLKKTGGNVSATARNLDVNRVSLSRVISNEPALKTLTEEERGSMVDLAEYGLKGLLCNQEHKDFFGAVKYTLSTLGKNRGYTEKQELDVATKGQIVVVGSAYERT